MKFTFYLLILITLAFFSSCENDITVVNEIVSREQINFEIAKEVEIFYSDSAMVRVKVQGPVMKRFLDRKAPYEEFPEGIYVEFYGSPKKVSSFMSAKHAVRYENKEQINVTDSVVWQSKSQERLETEELIWDEKQDKVYTNQFVTIIKPDEIIYGHGFEANQDFTKWKINAIEGVIKVDGIADDLPQ